MSRARLGALSDIVGWPENSWDRVREIHHFHPLRQFGMLHCAAWAKMALDINETKVLISLASSTFLQTFRTHYSRLAVFV